MNRCLKIYLSLFVLALLALCFFPLDSRADVWKTLTDRQWLGPVSNNTASPNSKRTWEDAYSQWVHDTVTEDFFLSPTSAAYNLKTDCAEAQYTFRIIFAAKYGLPFVIANGRISNATKRFDYIQDSQARLVEFIKFVNANTNTTTLSQDTYPVAINASYVRPGTIFLYKASHSMLVHEVSPFGVLSLVFASTPKQVWRLKLRTEIDQPPVGTTSHPDDGLRSWRHQELGLPATQEPGYSTEQFTYINPGNNPGGIDYGSMIESNLQSVQESPEIAIRRAAVNVASALLERVKLVTDGVVYKSLHPACMSSAQWQDQSTVHKDLNIKIQFQKLEQSIEGYADSPEVTELQRIRNEVFAMTDIYYNPTTHAVYALSPSSQASSQDLRLDLSQLEQSFLNQVVSSDPNDSIERRWGLGSNQPRVRCPQFPD